MIEFTEKALLKLKEIAESEGIDNLSVRDRIIPGGCAGFGTDMVFEDKIDDMDEIIEQEDVKIICDPISLMYLEETTIDYLDGAISSGFKFNIPGSKGSCGCGKSYSF